MKKAIKNINTCLSIYLNPTEREDLHKRMLASTCRSKSEFVRKILFGKTLRTLVWNESIDDMIEELVVLRKELARLENNPSLSVGDKWQMYQVISQIKEKVNQIADHVCKGKL